MAFAFLVVVPEGDLLSSLRLQLFLLLLLPVVFVVIPQRSGGICFSSVRFQSHPHDS
jgi:hypothetical protein